MLSQRQSYLMKFRRLNKKLRDFDFITIILGKLCLVLAVFHEYKNVFQKIVIVERRLLFIDFGL